MPKDKAFGFDSIEDGALLEFERACAEFELPVIGHGFKAQRRARVLAAFNRLKELSLLDSLTENESIIAMGCGGEFPPKPAKRKKLEKVKPKSYGPPRYSDEQPMENRRPPTDATHLEFSNSKVSIVDVITKLADYETFRGKIRFGRLRYGEDFIPCEGEEANTESPLAPDVVKIAPEEKAVVIVAKKKPAPPPGRGKPVDSAPVHKMPAAKPAASGKSLRPGSPDSKTGQVWTIADKLKAKGGDVTKDAVLAIALKAGLNPGMVGVQFSRWKKEN